jgi:hypothetical protein
MVIHNPHVFTLNRSSGQGEFDDDLSMTLKVIAASDDDAKRAVSHYLAENKISPNGIRMSMQVRLSEEIIVSDSVHV